MANNIRKEYFSFTKKERNAVAILIGIAVVFIIITYAYSPQFKKPFVNKALQQHFTALQNNSTENSDSLPVNEEARYNPENSSANSLHPFGFNPNTMDATGFKELGLSEKLAQTIISFRNKGGHFNTPDDFRKIEGLSSEAADILLPYIDMPAKQQVAKTVTETKELQELPKPQASIKKLDINTATAEDWKTLPGIGDVLGNRIVKFRNAVHGFKTVEDLRKTYGLSDSVYQAILPFLIIGNAETK